MAIREKSVNGHKQYEVYIGLRSKIRPEIRVQRMRKQVQSRREALSIEKLLIREASLELGRLEGSGLGWGEVLERFELAHRRGSLTLRPVQLNYLTETVSMLRNFTSGWLKKNCQEVSPADVRIVFQQMEENNYSRSRIRAVKSGINTIYRWGIETGNIVGIVISPAQMVQLNKSKDEKPPQILSFPEIQKLIVMAKEVEHPWYPVWMMALNTGMRSGELYALEWADIDFDLNLITVSKSYNNRMDIVKSTKAGYWRKVPINSDLQSLLQDLRSKSIQGEGDGKHVLPRLTRWANGEAAKFLRDFCEQIGITSVNFHALRACFATHLLNSGVSSPVVKKICGWTEEKVMTRYIRLAGIDVAGATQGLGFNVPSFSPHGNVVSLKSVKSTRKANQE